MSNTFTFESFKVDQKFSTNILVDGNWASDQDEDRIKSKSEIACSIANMYNKINDCHWLIFCESKYSKEFWVSNCGSPNLYIRRPDEKGLKVLENILLLFKQRANNLKKKMPSIGLIFDNICLKKVFKKSKLYEKLILNGRHYNCNIIINCCDIKQLPPILRVNYDNMFIFNNNDKSLKYLYDFVITNKNFELKMFLDLINLVTHPKIVPENRIRAVVYKNGVETDKIDMMFKIHECCLNFINVINTNNIYNF